MPVLIIRAFLLALIAGMPGCAVAERLASATGLSGAHFALVEITMPNEVRSRST